MAEIAKIVQGNNFNIAIPLKVYILNEGEVVLQNYTPAEGDDVTIRLVGERRGYTYKPTIEGNVAHLQLSGHEVCDTYAVEVVIIGTDGTMLRSYRGDQLAIVYNVDTIIADGAVEEGELYLDSQFFIQGQKGEQGNPGQDGTDGQDGADGRGIVSITKTATQGLVDTYTITYTDGTTSTFEVTNGKDGGGEDSLIVTLTYQSGTYIADKTYNEITAAIQAGRYVLVFSSVSQNYATLSRATSGKVEFSHIESVGSQMMGQLFVCYSNNTWATSSKTIQQGLVSGTTIKTINSTSLLGSGDIAVAEEFIVNVTRSGGVFVADKTLQECITAFGQGLQVVFTWSGGTGIVEYYIAVRRLSTYYGGQYYRTMWAFGVNGSSVQILKYDDSGITLSLTPAVVDNTTSYSTTAALSANQGRKLQGLVDAKANTADLAAVATSGNYNDLADKPSIPAAQVNADWDAASGVAQILNKPTIPDLATYCPIIEDTRQSAVATITGVAPFASLVDGQRIVLHLAFPNLNQPTLQLTLSNGTQTSAYNIYGQIHTDVVKLWQGYYRAGVYLPMIFASNRWNVIADVNTLYDGLTQALLNAGTNTSDRLISAKLLCDNFQKHTAIETMPSGAIAPTAGYEPNKMYDFGKVASVTFATYDTSKEIANAVNLYMCTFVVASGGTTLHLNANIKYPNGDDGSELENLLKTEDRVFEITIRDNKLSYLYFD